MASNGACSSEIIENEYIAEKKNYVDEYLAKFLKKSKISVNVIKYPHDWYQFNNTEKVNLRLMHNG